MTVRDGQPDPRYGLHALGPPPRTSRHASAPPAATGVDMAGWRPTPALLSAVGTVLVLVLFGVALHRPDCLLLAAPLGIATVVALTRAAGRPGGGLSARLSAPAERLPEDSVVSLTLDVRAPPNAELVTATVLPGRYLTLLDRPSAAAAPPPDHPTASTDEAADAGADGNVDRGVDGVLTRDADGGGGAGEVIRIAFGARTARWGRTRTGRARVDAWAAQGLLHRGGFARDSALTVVFGHERFTASDVVPPSAGVVGAHRSRRPGEGSDLAGVRPFVAGDRLRRINWPVSLRTDVLHVTATVTDLDTTVMIIVDSSVDAGGDDESGGSLALSVRAAASVAEHYLHAGDRVGLLDTRGRFGLVAPGAGRRHLDRIVDVLVDADARPTGGTEPVAVTRTLARLAPRALVVLISPLLDQARPELAVAVARSGHPVLVIDALGDDRPAAAPGSSLDLAWRLQRLQHARDIDRLADLGIPVTPWRGAGTLDAVLRSLARASAAPRRSGARR